MYYKISPDKDTESKIFASEEFFKRCRFKDTNSITITAGKRTHQVQAVLRPDIIEDELMISKNVLDLLSIPDNIKYQIKFTKNGIKIGPIIGLLMFKSKENISRGNLKEFLNYTLIYPEIQGLLVVFFVEGIDFENDQIEGYYYNPESNTGKTIWKEGKFPIPDAIFHRTYLPESVRLRLKSYTGNKLFNSNCFNKWEFWNMLSGFPQIKEHLPYTRLCSSKDDIDFMLDRFDAAYLKPLNGTLSRGLYKVTKKGDAYTFKSAKEGPSAAETTGREETEQYIKYITGDRMYIAQQALSPISIENRHIDFRVIMQKDETMKWNCTGIFAFLGMSGNICSNWGFETSFEELLSKYFNFSQKDIFQKKQEIVGLCRDICEILDSTHENYGDFGFDVLLDKALKVWVLETNKRHYHSVPLWSYDVQTFYEVKSNPMKYAAALSGFEVY